MSDSLKDRGPADAKRINVHESWEVTYWTKALGVTKAELEEAVKAAGVSAEKVREYLKNKK